MSYSNYFFRKIRNGYNRLRLKNKDFSLFASNCNGGCICHDLGLPFRSPFVNLYLTAPDFVRFLQAPREYLACPLEFQQTQKAYPVAKLKDVTLHFMHYDSAEAAQSAWERRTMRINWDDLFVLMSDQDGCTEELLQKFDALPYRHKAVFTHVPQPQIRSAVYIPGFEDKPSVGNCDAFVNQRRGKKYFDAFDYVKWFNEGK